MKQTIQQKKSQLLDHSPSRKKKIKLFFQKVQVLFRKYEVQDAKKKL
jgi:hypothetical protein